MTKDNIFYLVQNPSGALPLTPLLDSFERFGSDTKLEHNEKPYVIYPGDPDVNYLDYADHSEFRFIAILCDELLSKRGSSIDAEGVPTYFLDGLKLFNEREIYSVDGNENVLMRARTLKDVDHLVEVFLENPDFDYFIKCPPIDSVLATKGSSLRAALMQTLRPDAVDQL